MKSGRGGYGMREKYDESAVRSVLARCGGRFLYACKKCYSMNPRLISKLHPDETAVRCLYCGQVGKIFLHERVTENDNGAEFHEYQVVRDRATNNGRSNIYCRFRHICRYGEECRFAHTFLEMVVWKMESDKRRFRSASRESLAMYSNKLINGRLFHCRCCCRNFESNSDYSDHLKTDFHLSMLGQMGKNEDVLWYYKPCVSEHPKKCIWSYDGRYECGCPLAHSEKEFEEWQKRLSLTKERQSLSPCTKREELPLDEYITHIYERIQNEQISEVKNDLPHKVMEMKDKEALWSLNYKIAEIHKAKPLKISFLQPAFSIKRANDSKYSQHLCGLYTYYESMLLLVRFENPGIFGQYSGTLVFDYGKDTPVISTSFNVTIKGSGSMEQHWMQTEILTQNWNANRIIVPYPELPYGEAEYETKAKRLEKEYIIPPGLSLREVKLENLTPKNYAKKMHVLLYMEELARQAVLTRLNIECQLSVQRDFYTSTMFMGSKSDGSLYGLFSSPMRLSTDSDEGILVRDGCSKVLIGVKEGSTVAYECKMELWENNRVYISLPARCVSDLKLQSGNKVLVVIQYQLDRSMFCLRHHAIDNLKERIDLICPQQMSYAKLNYSALKSGFLDDTQNKVLSHICAAKKTVNRISPSPKTFPPLVMAGPFGTGKTHTIRNVILYVLDNDGEQSRILLCTHSNSAADLYIKDICNDPRWCHWTDKILRVMYHRRNPSTVLVSGVLNFCLFADAGRSAFRYPSSAELLNYRIIITTFSTSSALGQLGAGLPDDVFTHIFLDEASQAMEPEVIMPLTLASLTNTRIVIAGDHRQINERMFLSDDLQVPTLLERMYNAYNKNHWQHRLLLCNNYRCVDGLLQLISHLFYPIGMLRSAGNSKLVDGFNAVHFVHIKGKCEVTDAGDFVNDAEACQVVQQVEELLASHAVTEEDIMVSAPYYTQIQRIRELLRRKGLGKVSAYPARNVQALQFRVVIFSCVMRRVTCLSCIGENFGFLSDANLLNTVLTRAKSLVFAIGDAVTLCSTGRCQEYWEIFLQYCAFSKTIHPHYVDIHSLQRDIHQARLPLRPLAEEFVPAALRKLELVQHSPQPPSESCARSEDVSFGRAPKQEERKTDNDPEGVSKQSRDACAKSAEDTHKRSSQEKVRAIGCVRNASPKPHEESVDALKRSLEKQESENDVTSNSSNSLQTYCPSPTLFKRSPEQEERKSFLKERFCFLSTASQKIT